MPDCSSDALRCFGHCMKYRPPLPFTAWLRGAMRHPGFATGTVLLALLCLAAVLSFFWTPHDPYAVEMAARLQPPGWTHWLGTDAYGRDIASQLLVGARNCLWVGLAAVGLGLTLGTALGLLALVRRGWVDEVVARFCDFSFAFPALLTAIMLAAAFGPGVGNVIVAIGIFNIPVFARLTRTTASAIWTRDYILAARACGRSPQDIARAHVLPNILAVLLVQATSQFALAVLAEAALSYLGLGTQPPMPSWGRMLSDAQSLLFQAPLLAIFPGVAIMLVVLGLNLLGDGLRDLLDPRTSSRHL